MQVRKYDTRTMAKNGSYMDALIVWGDNENFSYQGGGRIAVHENGSTETIFVATSQEREGVTTPGYYDSVELVRMTMTDDVGDCGALNSCVRHALDPWKKVLAIAPVDATTARFLLALPHISNAKTLEGNLELQILIVNFKTEDYFIRHQVSHFMTFNFYSTQDLWNFWEIYDLPHLVARPYFGAAGSTTFEDFYLTISLEGLPDNTEWAEDRMATTFTLLNDRVTDFFSVAHSYTLPDSGGIGFVP